MSDAITLPVNLSVGTFDAYLNVVRQMPKLTPEQERALAIRFRDEGDLNAARELVMANLRFVVHVARGYSGYGLSMPDIIQEGNVGLMKAVKRFDPDLGVRLVSFAVHWIKAEIHEFVIRNWGIVKIATTKAQRKLFFNLRKAKSHLGWLTNDEAEAIAGDLNVEVSTVFEMEKRLGNKDISFDLPADEEAEENYLEPASYIFEQNDDPAIMLENTEWQGHEQKLLTQALDELDERSLDIVHSRWLADEKATLHELAERHQVSAERIRQLEQNAMKKLRAAVVFAA
ncbi:MAG: RNA polymerase sigma factor RpoH [Gammaproteobacteria bacterium]|nr:RNA polymerase sigma factor RpoH [Gammaproteobacteria bacterium]